MNEVLGDGESCSLESVRGALPDRELPTSSTLADYTTFHIGGEARSIVRASSEDEIIEAVRAVDDAGEPLLVLSGGSNVLISDSGLNGTVVLIDNHGVDATVSSCAGAFVTVKAGEVWDEFVEFCVEQEWAGVEALSGIPGLVGATPIQNVGAYGQEVSQTIARVRTWDREAGELRTFVADQCEFGYRDSIFKRSRHQGDATGRYVVLEVSFQFRLANLSEPIAYRQLADRLGVEVGDRVPARQVRDAVLELRASKGMVLDPDDRDTWSAGSFFTNPIVDSAVKLPDEAPRFPMPDGRVKTSAAWLIDHAGCPKGYPGEGPARLSRKHVLALTNADGARASDILDLARDVRDRVAQRYGITLVNEPILVGETL